MDIEIRAADEAIISGYINAAERYSKPIRQFRKRFIEKVSAGAFDRAIKRAAEEKRAILMLLDHDKAKAAADTLSGSLELREDNIGLYGRAVIRDKEIIAEIREHKPRGWSFGFRALEDEFKEAAEGLEERTLKEIELTEVSLIVRKQPAYIATSVEVRDAEEICEYRLGEDECRVTVDIDSKTEGTVLLSRRAGQREPSPCLETAEGYAERVKFLRSL